MHLASRSTTSTRRAFRLVATAAVVVLATTAAACGGDDSSGSSGSKDKAKAKAKAAATPQDTTKVIDSGSGKGDFATASADGTIKDPTVISVKVTPSPEQKTEVSWTTSCTKGKKSDSTGGAYKLTKASTTALKKPKPGSDSCIVAATAQLLTGGTIKIQLIG